MERQRSLKQDQWLKVLLRESALIMRIFFSSIAIHKSIRILLSIAVCLDYETWQMDVRTALLNDNLEEESICSNQRDLQPAKRITWCASCKSPFMGINRRPGVGTFSLIKWSNYLVSLRIRTSLVYTRNHKVRQQPFLYYIQMTSCSLEMMWGCCQLLRCSQPILSI